MTDSTPPASRLPLLINFANYAAAGIPAGMMSIAWLYMQQTFGLTLEALGVFMLMRTVGALLVVFNSGALIGRLGIGPFLFIGNMIATLGYAGVSLAPTWPALLAAGAVLGVGTSMIISGTNTFVAAHYPASHMNWLHGIFGLGQTIGPTFFTIVVLDLNRLWQFSFVLMGIPTAALALAIALTLRHWRLDLNGAEDSGAPGSGPVSLRASLTAPAVLAGMIFFFLYAGPEIGTAQLTPPLLTGARGLDTRTVGLWISAYWGSLTAGRILLGFVVDRVGPNRLLRLSTAGAVLGALLIWWNPVDVVSLIGLVVTGFSISTISPTFVSLTPQRVGPRHAPNAIGFQMAAASLGIALWPGLGGLLAERISLDWIGPFLVGMALATFVWHETILWQVGHGLGRGIHRALQR